MNVPFVNYVTHNYCGPCDIRFLKSTGVHCPECRRRARTAARVSTKNREDIRMRVSN